MHDVRLGRERPRRSLSREEPVHGRLADGKAFSGLGERRARSLAVLEDAAPEVQ